MTQAKILENEYKFNKKSWCGGRRGGDGKEWGKTRGQRRIKGGGSLDDM